MIRLGYKDAYQIERMQEFDNLEAAKLAFAGCVTLPDYYPVTHLSKDGVDLGFKGTIGELYQYFQTLD